MRSRDLFRTIAPCAAMLVASDALALEKTAARMTDGADRGSWSQCVTTCTIRYYNFCTGWVWLWQNLGPDARFGMWFQTSGISDVPGRLNVSWQHVTGAPSGYGYTGMLSIHPADSHGCPVDPPLYSQPWLPPMGAGWSAVAWGGPQVPLGEPGWILLTTTGAASGSPVGLWTDRPSGGPTGPVACGTCYPTGRVGHSFYYGTTDSPLCPGERLSDGACSVELLWEVSGTIEECTTCSVATSAGASLESSSWARVKALYRD
jgi:hypothetical protein